MKKILCILLLATGISFAANAQGPAFSIEVVNAGTANSRDGSLIVKIDNSQGSLTVFLYKDAPWKGGELVIKLSEVKQGDLLLNELIAGDYYVIVEDTENIPQAKAVTIGYLQE